jgi:hypothetical protein
MRYFSIDTLGDPFDPQLCVLDAIPEGIGVKYSRLVTGRSIADDFPAGAEIHMSPQREGIKLGKLIGSIKSFLLLHRDVKDVLAREFERSAPNAGIEYLPFTLINHRGAPHSRDYFIINPLGTWDCLDVALSEVEYFEDTDKVLDVGQIVLAPEKLVGSPPLFRIKELPSTYVVSEPIAVEVRERRFSNIILTELDQRPERPRAE